jgi:hypothetical protein
MEAEKEHQVHIRTGEMTMNTSKVAMTSVLTKLSQMRNNLSKEEQAVLDAIVVSAPDEVNAHSLTSTRNEALTAKAQSVRQSVRQSDEDEVDLHVMTSKAAEVATSSATSRNVSIRLDEQNNYTLVS